MRVGLVMAWMAVALLWAGPARAQICAGRAAFNAVPVQAGGGGAVSPASRALRATAGRGTDRLFGMASIVREWNDSADRFVGMEVSAGADQAVTLDNRVHLCPMFGAGYGWWDTAAGGRAGSGAVITASVRLGLLAVNQRTRAIIPMAALDLSRRPAAGGGAERALAIGGGLGVLRRGSLGVHVELAAVLTRRALDPRVSFGATYGR